MLTNRFGEQLIIRRWVTFDDLKGSHLEHQSRVLVEYPTDGEQRVMHISNIRGPVQEFINALLEIGKS